MRTYKDLQDTVLQWMADESDTGLLLTLVKDALNRAHQNLLNDDRYDFMLWNRNETLSVTSGQKVYALHPRFGHPLFFYNPTTNQYLEEITPKGLLEAAADWDDGEATEPDRFMLTNLSKVQAQPATAGVPSPSKTRLAVSVVAPVPPLATVTVSESVDPAAVTVIAADPSKLTPLMARAVCSTVAVPALPVIVVWSPVLVPELVPENVPLCVASEPRPRFVRAVP